MGPAQQSAERRRRVGRVVAMPLLVAAATFGIALAYFSLSGGEDAADETATAPAEPPRAATAPETLPAASGPGRLLITVTAESRETGHLHVVSLDGTTRTAITKLPRHGRPVNDYSAAWSPDGRRITFARTEPRAGGAPPRLYVIRADGSGFRSLTNGGAAEFLPAWSPDGRTIAFTRESGSTTALWLVRPDGSGLRKLVDDPRLHEDFPAWSPDGRTIAFTTATAEDEDLHLVDADGTNERVLLDGPTKDSAPAWSPSGTQIVFVRDGRVHVMGAHGGGLRPLTRGAEDAVPRWSPDGDRIAFTRWPGEILVMDADGSDLARVPVETAAFGAEWEPEP